MDYKVAKIPVRKPFYGLLIILFLLFLVWEYTIFLELHNNLWGFSSPDSYTVFHILKTTQVFMAALFMLVPIIGIFLKTRVGWVMVTSYFYFLIVNILVIWGEGSALESEDLVIGSVFILIFSLLLYLMNKSLQINEYHKTLSSNRSLLNLSSVILGFGLAMLLLFSKS